jgi:hypothetical protein
MYIYINIIARICAVSFMESGIILDAVWIDDSLVRYNVCHLPVTNMYLTYQDLSIKWEQRFLEFICSNLCF